MLLKVGIMALLVALTVVSVLLMYYIKKKVCITRHQHRQKHKEKEKMKSNCVGFCQKPQYQPQLQMIQMVGPNDNDYIYINFKDFNYDKKWEFPRENLELGRSHKSIFIKNTEKIV